MGASGERPKASEPAARCSSGAHYRYRYDDPREETVSEGSKFGCHLFRCPPAPCSAPHVAPQAAPRQRRSRSVVSSESAFRGREGRVQAGTTTAVSPSVSGYLPRPAGAAAERARAPAPMPVALSMRFDPLRRAPRPLSHARSSRPAAVSRGKPGCPSGSGHRHRANALSFHVRGRLTSRRGCAPAERAGRRRSRSERER